MSRVKAVSLTCSGNMLLTSCFWIRRGWQSPYAVFFVVDVAVLAELTSAWSISGQRWRAAVRRMLHVLDRNTSDRSRSRTDIDWTGNSKLRFDVERELLVTCCIYMYRRTMENSMWCLLVIWIVVYLFIECGHSVSLEFLEFYYGMRYMYKY